jgi:hypothetical protein
MWLALSQLSEQGLAYSCCGWLYFRVTDRASLIASERADRGQSRGILKRHISVRFSDHA